MLGTVIVVGVSREKIAIAADSRTATITLRRLQDGTQQISNLKYNDSSCKLIQLSPTLLFAADGQTSSSVASLPASALYDANELARLAARRYKPTSNSLEDVLSGGTIAAIATRWAWDVDFRMHRAFSAGWKPIQTLEGIFVGLEPNGETAMAVAKLTYPTPRRGLRVPPVELTIGTLTPPPSDFTWVESFGMKDVVESYRIPRGAATQEVKAENQRLRHDIEMDPKSFSAEVPERLVDLTIKHYQAAAQPNDPLFVHGPIDVATVERHKKVEWVHAKQCSGLKPATSAKRESRPGH
jgi:hypothetical protein